MSEPTTITFRVEVGQEWRDPQGTVWKVVDKDADGVRLEPLETDTRWVPFLDLVREFRRLDSRPSS